MKLPFDFLAFRQALYHLYQQTLSPALSTYDLSQMELDILLFFANNPEYDTASQLVSVRRLTKSQVSVAVEQLCRRGYLKRTSDAKNQRIQHLSLLPAASDAVAAGQAGQQRFWTLLHKGISDEDFAVFARVMEQLLKNAGPFSNSED